jgi:hypothetical protein
MQAMNVKIAPVSFSSSMVLPFLPEIEEMEFILLVHKQL